MIQLTPIETESRWRRHYDELIWSVFMRTIILWIAPYGFCVLLIPSVQIKLQHCFTHKLELALLFSCSLLLLQAKLFLTHGGSLC